MAQKEVKQWITVKGRHIPIFEGESKEEAIKRATKSAGKGATKISESDEVKEAHPEAKKALGKDLKNAQDQVDKLKAELKKHPDDVHTDYIKEQLKKAKAHYKKLSAGDNSSDENFKTAKEWDKEEKKASSKKEATKKSISKDLDEKEKQIAQHKEEADRLNGKEPAYKQRDDYENASEYRKGVLRKQFERNKNPYKELVGGSFMTDKQSAANEAAAENWERERAKYMASKEKKSSTKSINADPNSAEFKNAQELHRVQREADHAEANGVHARQALKKGESYTFDWNGTDGKRTVTGKYEGGEIHAGEVWSYFRGEDGKRYGMDDYDIKHRANVRPAEGKESEKDTSDAYKKNWTKERALKEVEDQLTYHYKNPETTKGDQPVLLSKNGRYSVARNWDEADHAEKYGWKYEPIDKDTAASIGERARNAAKGESAGNDLSKLSDKQLRETAKNTLASGNANGTYELAQDAKRRGLKDLTSEPSEGKGSYTVSINQGTRGVAHKTFNSAKEADDFVTKQVKAGNGSNTDYSIKYNEPKSSAKSDTQLSEKLSKYKDSLANASNKASYLSWLVRSGKITESEREQLRATYKKPKTAVQKQISKDLDTKEKQIAQHKAEADRLNGKSSGTVARKAEIDRLSKKGWTKTYATPSKEQIQADIRSMVEQRDAVDQYMKDNKAMHRKYGVKMSSFITGPRGQSYSNWTIDVDPKISNYYASVKAVEGGYRVRTEKKAGGDAQFRFFKNLEDAIKAGIDFTQSKPKPVRKKK